MTRPLIGLALGGGGAKGWAHIGVLRALTQAGIEPDLIAGTSVGGLVGALYLAGKLDPLEKWARSLSALKMISYLDFRIGGGMIRGHRLSETLREHVGDLKIENLRLPFVCIATDLHTGHEVWLRRGNLVDMLGASYALPGLFSPVHVEGRWLVDGALVNPLPISVCRALGAHVVLAVNLSGDHIGRHRATSPRRSSAGPGPLIEIPQEAEQHEGRFGHWLRGMFGQETESPGLFGVMVQSLSILLDRVTASRLAGEPPDATISPRLGHIGLLEFDKAAEIIVEGAAATERALADIGEAIALVGNCRWEAL